MSTSSMTSATVFAPHGHNHLLDLLPADDLAWLSSRWECRQFTLSEIFVRRDRPITHVYFPTTSIASVITQMDSGEVIETGAIGNEGFIGSPVVLEAMSTPNEIICQNEGEALVLRVADFQAALERTPVLHSLLNRYIQYYLVQLSQSVACNRLHDISQRCAKLLVMAHDRRGTDMFQLTQEFLAMMMGVRRASVSVAAAAFKDAGLITYHRGAVTVLDRSGLEAVACECYRVTREEYDRLVG